jgi:hypothetical protein
MLLIKASVGHNSSLDGYFRGQGKKNDLRGGATTRVPKRGGTFTGPPQNAAALERAPITDYSGPFPPCVVKIPDLLLQDLVAHRGVIHGARRRVIKNPPKGHGG